MELGEEDHGYHGSDTASDSVCTMVIGSDTASVSIGGGRSRLLLE